MGLTRSKLGVVQTYQGATNTRTKKSDFDCTVRKDVFFRRSPPGGEGWNKGASTTKVNFPKVRVSLVVFRGSSEIDDTVRKGVLGDRTGGGGGEARGLPQRKKTFQKSELASWSFGGVTVVERYARLPLCYTGRAGNIPQILRERYLYKDPRIMLQL